VATTTISLPDDQLARLRQHALASARSLDEVVQEAVNAYLSHLPKNGATSGTEPPHAPADPEWEPVTRIAADGTRVRIPTDLSPEEADAYVQQPSPEARREYLAAWLGKRGARIISEPPPGPPGPEWQARSRAALARIHASIPDDMTPDEIEQLITEVSEEARQERIARRESKRQKQPARRVLND
jgi:hypothetical protein